LAAVVGVLDDLFAAPLNLAVFTLPESPLRARELRPLQRLSYFVSLAAYLAPPMRLLLMLTLALVLWFRD
jgi:hypothetical protein